MSDHDRNKFYPKKKIFSARDSSSSFNRSHFGSKSEAGSFSKYGKDSREAAVDAPKKQPTILIKARETTNEDAVASPKRSQKEDVGPNVSITSTMKENEATPAPTLKYLTKATKLIDDGIICTESIQDYVQENNDFLVVGVVGSHGVGKSTLVNLLSHNRVTEEIKQSIFKTAKRNTNDESDDNIKILTEHFDKVDLHNDVTKSEIFKIQTSANLESNCNTTQGIDMFITSNRVILLDCQPLMSVSILDDLVQSENKRTNLVSEFIPLENSGEIQSLQLTAFLMSVCHVLLVVQDWFFDSNLIRFIHSAEMLKPTISNPEDELMDYFPHLLLVHNRAQMEDFSPARFKVMQQTYKMLFQKTKLHIKSNMGLGSGRIINYLNKENCGGPINLFLIPEIDPFSNTIYSGHPPIEELIKRLRAIIMGATKNPLTHVQLTEKTWLVYCSKVWDTVKKSSFFVEYTKLMP